MPASSVLSAVILWCRRPLQALALLLAVSACAPTRPLPPGPAPAGLRLIGETTLPHRLAFKGTTVGGLSGLDYDAAHDLWFALSDDRSDLQAARFYTLRLGITASALAAPELTDVVSLRRADGTPFPGRRQDANANVPDPEAIRYRPQTQTLLWTSEGDVRHGDDPSLCEMRPDGTHLRCFTLPGHLRTGPPAPADARDARDARGPRDNLTFEGLALTPDGRGAWVAMENALLQDGPMPTVGAPGGPCRITLFDLVSGQAVAQRAYVPDAIPHAPVPAGAYADNGISEILALDTHRLLVLERAYITGVGNALRLYQVDTRDGSDTLAQPTLRPGEWRPMRKTLVADFASFRGPQADGRPGLLRLDNTEGMAWGPRLPGPPGRPGEQGARTLVFVSDDNFNPHQVTQLMAFEFLETSP